MEASNTWPIGSAWPSEVGRTHNTTSQQHLFLLDRMQNDHPENKLPHGGSIELYVGLNTYLVSAISVCALFVPF